MEELGPSILGTLEYWNRQYKSEINHFLQYGDVGEIWFGEDIVDRILRWMRNNAVVGKTSTILDIGCGNGMLLVELYRQGYYNLEGWDYSQNAISLAEEIAKNENAKIELSVVDILNPVLPTNLFDIVLDKGTYDAVSLSVDAKENRNTYIDSVYKCLKEDGLLIITSCNWTKSELSSQFESKFHWYDDIPTPQFKFGGKIGNVVTSIVFVKKCIDGK